MALISSRLEVGACLHRSKVLFSTVHLSLVAYLTAAFHNIVEPLGVSRYIGEIQVASVLEGVGEAYLISLTKLAPCSCHGDLRRTFA